MGRKMIGWKGLIKGVTAFILALVMAMSQIPGTDFVLTAYADSDKTITGLCTGTIGNPTESAGGWSKVYYGTYGGSAMLYRVLTKSTTDFGGSTMLLDCDRTLLNMAHGPNPIPSGYRYNWADSNIKTWLNGNEFYGSTDVFTTQEKAAIAGSTKGSAASGDGNGWSSLGYAPLTGEHVFLLDAVEATRPSYGYANTDGADANRSKSGTAPWWWLRSPYSNDADDAGDVNPSGNIDYGYVDYDFFGVSPAFNINLASVIFSSVISDGYKLTVKDTDMTIATTGGSAVTREGNVVTVPYTISGTNAANATQVSVLLTNSAFVPGETKTSGYSYQKLNVTTWDTSGTGTFTLPAAYANKTCGTEYYAYILAEDVNADTATDYASAPASITIPAMSQVATPTFSPGGGTYTEAKDVTISCETDGADIYYTTDESTPSKDHGTKYTSAINVSETTTIKAIAVKTGMTDSAVATAKYTISDSPVPPVTETCTISFDKNGGKGEMNDQVVDKGVKTQLNKNRFTRDGYSFDSWNTDPDGDGKSYDDKDYITIEKDTTLYAQWKKGKPKHDDDDEETEEPSKPAVVNPDTVEGYFAVNGQPVPGVAMGKTVQGAAAQAVFNATRPAGWMQAFTFNMAINGKIDYTLKNGVLTIIIPKEYQKAGRTFAIMALDKNGRAWTYADTDTNPATVTATINFEGYAFALIYRD